MLPIMRIPQYKPLSFSTTMRNPARIVGFLNCIKPFEGQLLTNEIIKEIVKKVLQAKLYCPNHVKNDTKLKKIYNDVNITFSDKQCEDIMSNSPQSHKEAGFDEGWPSRFDTWYKLGMEFGFLYYEIDKRIEISSSGHMLCNAYQDSNDDASGEKIQDIFLNALIKYQTDNPFRRNRNSNAPFVLLLEVIKFLKNDPEYGDAGVSRKEIPFITCWKNNDAEELYLFIKQFRNSYGFTASDEQIYGKCLELLESQNEIRFKMNQIMKEGVDDFIRKMRITGIISLRGMGRFIDFNAIEQSKIDYILSKYREYPSFSNEYDYYKYMGEIDDKIISIKPDITYNIEDIRTTALAKWAEHYSKEKILEELELLGAGKASRDEFLRDIEQPTRLEFLTSITLKQHYPSVVVKPNYAIDDEGNPTFTACGGIADIEVYDEKCNSLFEVTLMKSKAQAVNEIPAITRHLKELNCSTEKKSFSVFVAPVLHDDTIYMIKFTKAQYGLDILGYKISDFVEAVSEIPEIIEFANSCNNL